MLDPGQRYTSRSQGNHHHQMHHGHSHHHDQRSWHHGTILPTLATVTETKGISQASRGNSSPKQSKQRNISQSDPQETSPSQLSGITETETNTQDTLSPRGNGKPRQSQLPMIPQTSSPAERIDFRQSRLPAISPSPSSVQSYQGMQEKSKRSHQSLQEKTMATDPGLQLDINNQKKQKQAMKGNKPHRNNNYKTVNTHNPRNAIFTQKKPQILPSMQNVSERPGSGSGPDGWKNDAWPNHKSRMKKHPVQDNRQEFMRHRTGKLSELTREGTAEVCILLLVWLYIYIYHSFGGFIYM